MKKMIFLLLMTVLAGFVFAGAAHPPGAYSSEAVIALAEYSVQGDVVTQPTVLVLSMPVTAELSSFQAVMAIYNEPAIRPQSGFIIMNTGRSCTGCTADYYLRC